MMVERLFLAVPWGSLQFVIVVFPDHTHLLFWIFQTDRIPLTHWALDICRLSSAFIAELLVSLIQHWIFQSDRISSNSEAAVKEL